MHRRIRIASVVVVSIIIILLLNYIRGRNGNLIFDNPIYFKPDLHKVVDKYEYIILFNTNKLTS